LDVRLSLLQNAVRLGRRVGLDVQTVKRHPNLTDFLANRQVDLVLDVGANTGQFAQRLRTFGYRGEIISFEPLATAYETLKRVATRDTKWRACNLALGAVSEERILNVSESTDFSSLLKATDYAERFHSSARVVATQIVRVEPLDGLGLELAGRRAFLKIDTQGFEREVLEGARAAISQFQGVLMELPIRYLYEGVWSVSQAIDYMAGLGFAIAQVTPVNVDPLDPVSCVEIDCLFKLLSDVT
jgi:FkbM family methyltransferase